MSGPFGEYEIGCLKLDSYFKILLPLYFLPGLDPMSTGIYYKEPNNSENTETKDYPR
jgi:hypothetical protein